MRNLKEVEAMLKDDNSVELTKSVTIPKMEYDELLEYKKLYLSINKVREN